MVPQRSAMVVPPVADDVTEEREARRRELKACMAAEAAEDVEALRTALEAAKEIRLEKEDVLPAETLLRKLEYKFQPLTYSDVPHADMLRLRAAGTREKVVAILLQCFRVQLESSFLSEIIAEFHYHNYLFCQRSGLCAEKTSTVLSLMNTVYSRAMEGEYKVEQARALLDELLARHSRQLPPFSLGVFSAPEAAAVREYAERTLLRHYDMYAFVRAPERGQETDLCVRTVRQRVAGEMVEPVELRTAHEVDPREVPELQDLFRDPETEAAARAAAELEARRLADEAAAAAFQAPEEDGTEAEVAAAIDAAVAERLGGLESRLATAPEAAP